MSNANCKELEMKVLSISSYLMSQELRDGEYTLKIMTVDMQRKSETVYPVIDCYQHS